MAAPAETPLHRPELPEARADSGPVVLPPADDSGAGTEYCLVDEGGSWQPVRLAEHSFFWERPDVYRYLVRDLLEGQAAETISRMLARQLEAVGGRIDRLRLLDFGAGNGWVGGELAELGARWIYGVDRSPAAASAAARDYPGVYEDYLVMDMRRLSEAQRDHLMHFDFNGLASVDPLGADEPAPNAFTEAFNILAPGGWVAFHLHEEALLGKRESRFAPLVRQMVESGAISLAAQERYRHRLTTQGDPLLHVAFVGRKHRDFGA